MKSRRLGRNELREVRQAQTVRLRQLRELGSVGVEDVPVDEDSDAGYASLISRKNGSSRSSVTMTRGSCAIEDLVESLDRLPGLSVERGDAVGDLEVAASHVHGVERADVVGHALGELGERLLGAHAREQAVHRAPRLVVQVELIAVEAEVVAMILARRIGPRNEAAPRKAAAPESDRALRSRSPSDRDRERSCARPPLRDPACAGK